jgi:hypothetical protein
MSPLCVHCQAENDAVTPDNGVWTPDVNGDTVPVHSACIQNFLIKQSTANPAFSKRPSLAQ